MAFVGSLIALRKSRMPDEAQRFPVIVNVLRPSIDPGFLPLASLLPRMASLKGVGSILEGWEWCYREL